MNKKNIAKPGKPVALVKKSFAPKAASQKSAKPAAHVKLIVKSATGKKPEAAIVAAKATAKTAVKPAAKLAGKGVASKPATQTAPTRTIATVKTEAPRKTEGLKSKMVRKKVADIVLPPDYRPSETEPFMNEMHRAYFRKRLIEWKDEILRQTRETLAILHEDSTQHADLADRATSETDRATELRTRDRQRKLISKIEAALGRIEDGSYGYCEDTGEPIGLKRLDARPIATLSVEAQERHERRERVYREE